MQSLHACVFVSEGVSVREQGRGGEGELHLCRSCVSHSMQSCGMLSVFELGCDLPKLWTPLGVVISRMSSSSKTGQTCLFRAAYTLLNH